MRLKRSGRVSLAGLAAFAVLCAGLPGCASRGAEAYEATEELTVCIERFYASSYEGVFKQFREENPEIHLYIQEIPPVRDFEKSNPEREAFLVSTRAAMLAGGGPDIFLLSGYPRNGGNKEARGGDNMTSYDEEQLFDDVERTMRSAYMWDLTDLLPLVGIAVDDYLPAAMQAGHVGDGQFVFPISLRFSGYLFPREIYNKTPLAEWEGGLEAFYGVLSGFENTADKYNDISIDAMLVSPVVDYERSDYGIDEELYKFILAQNKTQYSNLEWSFDPGSLEPERYCDGFVYRTNSDSMYNLFSYATWFDENGYSPVFVPQPNGHGGTTAQVMSYAAVSANSANKLNAAKLLEICLRPENLVKYVPERKADGQYFYNPSLAYLPTRLDCWPDYFGATSGIFDNLENAITNAVFVPQHVCDSFEEAATLYYKGECTAGEALAMWEKRISLYLKEMEA